MSLTLSPAPLAALGRSRAAALLVPLLGYLVCLAGVGYPGLDLSAPFYLAGDNSFTVNFARSYIDGHGFRLNPALGFPGAQDNAFFPSFDFSYQLVLWLLAQVTRNPFLAYNLLYLVGVSAMFWAAFLSLRALRFSPWLSAFGAVITVLTPFFLWRSLAHDFLALSFSAPLGATLALLIGTMPAGLSARAGLRLVLLRPFSLLALLLVATSGLYYAFFTCLFAGFAGLAASLVQRRWAPLLAGLGAGVLIGPVLVLTGYRSSLPDVLAGRIPQVARAAYEQILYGLNPGEAVAAFAGLPGLSKMMAGYAPMLPLIPGSVGLFEWPGAALTLVIAATPLLALVLAGAPPERRGRWHALLLLATGLLLFGLFYAVRGGVGFAFNLLVAPNIRATDRILPFLTFLALVLALGGARAGMRARAPLLRVGVPGVILLALALSAWPNWGGLARKHAAMLAAPGSAQNVASVRALLAAKDAAGITTVLQLPHLFWPETGPVRGFQAYSHQNGYVLDRPGATTRWSYGAATTQPAFLAVRDALAGEGGIAQPARGLGFDAVLIEKAAYTRDELLALRARVESGLSAGCLVFDDAFRTLYALRAPGAACLRALGPGRAIDFGTAGNWQGFAGPGWWSVSDGEATWTEGPVARLDLILPATPAGETRELAFTLHPLIAAALPRREVAVSAEGRVLARWRFEANGWTERRVTVPADLTGRLIALDLVQDAVPSPRALGLSADDRAIGLAVRRVELVGAP